MDIENLKLILEALNTTTDVAKSAFIWWLIVSHVLSYVTIIVVVWIIARTILAATSSGRNDSINEQALIQVGRTLGVACSHPLIDEERARIFAAAARVGPRK